MSRSSFGALYRNVSAWLNWVSPFYFSFLYYFGLPTVVVMGKLFIIGIIFFIGLMSKPRSPLVEGALDFFFGSS